MSTAYRVRRLKLKPTDPLDRLARASGALYSQALVYFWRVVRKKGIWLSPTALMKLFRSDELYSQSAQATLQVFCASLKSWRQRRQAGSLRRPPTEMSALLQGDLEVGGDPSSRGLLALVQWEGQ